MSVGGLTPPIILECLSEPVKPLSTSPGTEGGGKGRGGEGRGGEGRGGEGGGEGRRGEGRGGVRQGRNVYGTILIPVTQLASVNSVT